MLQSSRTLAGVLVVAVVVFTSVACSPTREISSPNAPEALLPLAPEAVATSADCVQSWSVTGSLAKERSQATATRLEGGKVLVAGGFDGSLLTAAAELYNPATNAWSAAGTMNVPRYLHRSVRLQDGRVLVVGGFSDSGPTATVEIYDPATNAWSLAASMVTDRFAHHLTTLADGRVLVSGGIGGGFQALATAEVYDAASDVWSSAGSMTAARYLAAMALLPDGRVLVAGGNDGSPDYLSSAEIFDPSSGTWSAAPSMSAPQYTGGAAVLPDGRVLVAGGSDDLPGAEIFDPSSNTWSPTGDMVTARRHFAETIRLADGRVLVVGGTGDNGIMAEAEIFSPETGEWSQAANLGLPRYLAAATELLDGRILVAGGYALDGPNQITTNTAETYNACSLLVCTESWRPTGALVQRRYGATATRLADGTVIAAGGLGESGTATASAERYNPSTRAWSATGSLNVPRSQHRAVRLQDGRILVAGGFTNSPTATAEIYNPATGAWSLAASMSTGRYGHQLTVLSDGRVLAAGGIGGGVPALATAEVYNPVLNAWSPVGSMVSARSYAEAVILNNGRVMVAGGNGTSNNPLSSAEIFNPSSGTWSALPSMAAARSTFGMAALLDGRVLVAGGSTALPGAEIFDPASGAWSPTANMVEVPRTLSEAIRLADGRVLVAGGIGNDGAMARAEIFDPGESLWSPVASMSTSRYLAASVELADGQILVVGGAGNAGIASVAETYRPCPSLCNTWRSTGSLGQERYLATATRLADGTVLVAGGAEASSSAIGTVERYNPATRTWSAAGTLNVPRFGHRSVRLQNGEVLVVGGIIDSQLTPTDAAEIYNPAANTWRLAAQMSTPRVGPVLTVLSDGRVLAAGGINAGESLATAEIYNPLTNSWSSAGSMSSARSLAAATLLNNGRVLVAGGSYDKDDNGVPLLLSSAELFDPATGTWSAAASMTANRRDFGMALLPDGRALAAGGSTALPGAEIYDPGSNTWSPTNDMAQVPRYSFETIPLTDGRVVIVGGYDGNAAPLGGAEIFDPTIGGRWIPLAGMSAPRGFTVAAELPNKRILIAGGLGSAGITNAAATYAVCPPNQRPVAMCRQAQIVPAGPTCSVAIPDVNPLPPNGSYDPDDGPDPLAVSQVPAVGALRSLGTTTVTLTASDGYLDDSCSTAITVTDQTGPQLTCPANQVLACVCPDPQMLDCGGRGAATGTFTGTYTDNCSPGGTVTCSPSGQWLRESSTPYPGSCTATDGAGNQTTCNFTVTVVDNTPPVAGANKNFVLSPSSSGFVEVSLMNCADFATDSCHGRMHLRDWGIITHITSDEPAGPGGDMQVHSQHRWLSRLRPRSDANGNGRVYTLHYKVQPPTGPSVFSSCTVRVGATAAPGPGPGHCIESPHDGPTNYCP